MTQTSQDQQRIMILDQIRVGHLSTKQAAELLGKSERQVYRWKARYQQEGPRALIHGNRGKRSPHRIAQSVREQVIYLAQTRYAGCNQSHLRDLLEEREQICISRSSLRRMLQQAGVLVIAASKKVRHRLRRPRYPREGQLVQVDASPHAWLEDRGPRLSLVGGIDDATGKIVGAVFRLQEDQQGYFQMIEQMVQQYGCPQAIYHDRHTLFPKSRHEAKEQHTLAEQLAGTRDQTQLGRLFEQLQIRSIAAHSPQAKGRIERAWGTFQGRLVHELRIAGISTLQEANAFLPDFVRRYNQRFTVAAADPMPAWQAFPQTLSPQECFCWQEQRTVHNDNTISYQANRIQLLPGASRMSWARCKVVVYEQFDGSVRVRFQQHWIECRPAPGERSLQVSHSSESVAPKDTLPQRVRRKPPVPKADHPWRKRLVSGPSLTL